MLARYQVLVRVQFEPGRLRRHRSSGGPRDEGVEGRLPDVVLLRAGVDRESVVANMTVVVGFISSASASGVRRPSSWAEATSM